jgi:hypothetical protein
MFILQWVVGAAAAIPITILILYLMGLIKVEVIVN